MGLIERSRSLLLVGPVLVIAAGIPAYLLSDMPFGTLFETLLCLAVIGLILTLLTPGVRLLKTRRWYWKPIGGLLSIAALLILLVAVVVGVDYTLLPKVPVNRNLTVEQWREDLAYLAREMPLVHPRLFENVTEAEFYEAVSDLNGRIDALDDIQIKSEIVKIAALPNDAHTFPNIFSFSLDLHLYPLQVYLFEEGLMVVDAARENRDAIGCELVEIDGTPVEKVLQAVSPYLSAENESGARERSLAALLVSEWLYSSGVANHPDRAVFTFADEAGKRFSITMKPYNYIPVGYWAFGRTIENTFCPAKGGARRDNYMFEFHENTGTIYVQFNACVEEEDISFEEFVENLDAFVDTHDFERLVVDIRNNDGGDGRMVHPLADFISGHERVDRAGRLFVIIGRKTFSGGVMFAAKLGNTTKAIFVGEPSSQGPVFCSAPSPLTLPNCGMQIAVSRSLTLGSFAFDRRDRIWPDIPVGYTWTDYVSGRDPCMEAILAYEHRDRARPALGNMMAERYDGRYILEPYHAVTVSGEEGRLCIAITDFDPHSFQKMNSALYALSSTRFLTDIEGVEITFASIEEGPAQSLTIKYGSAEMEAHRAPDDLFLPMELVEQGQKEELMRGLLGERRDEYAARMPDLERFLNTEGYQHLGEGEYEMAIRVFRLNTELFPESSNVWDSIGEAYMEAGQEDLAIHNYEKSLELNPHNENAKQMLRKLR